jgi:hypothetical protein
MKKQISFNLRRLAKSILDKDIKNPLPDIKAEAEDIYQKFIASEDGKAIYEKATKKYPDLSSLPNRVDNILTTLRDDIKSATKNDPDKFQLINAYLRDKISEGFI